MTDIAALSSPGCKTGRLQRACLPVLRQHDANGETPTSTRFVYYELKQARRADLCPRGDRPDQGVIDAVSRVRKAGEVPWDWITDETRNIHVWAYADTMTHAVLDQLPHLRIDLWGGQPPPLIITEARTLAGVLRPVAARYLCPITSTNGQVGGFLHTDVAPLLMPGQAVAYFGDHNPAGSMIEANTRGVLEHSIGKLEWQRVAITAQQVADRQRAGKPLPPKPGTDRRFKDNRPHVSFEAEALGQSVVTAMLSDWLDARLPERINDVLEREAEQRDRLGRLLRSA